ncbi:MAG TPA: MYXO-CTERM sorting domain-containing protein, partial [Kofleriaceae bacterium]|nr:MYXO-CTERM sorting domain-containing protein [Kofleriaceae bacterium]
GPDVSGEALAAALSRAVERGTRHTAGCSYLDLSSTAAAAERGLDGHDGRFGVGFLPSWEGDSIELAVTGSQNLTGPPRDAGDVLEADIRLNAQDYTFVSVSGGALPTPRAGTELADLDYTLTHEIGHVLGLAHVCWVDPKEAALVDSAGVPLAPCDTLSANDPRRRSVMYPQAMSEPGWDLSADDAAGVCEIYPATVRVVPACHRVVEGGCAVAGDAPGATPWVLAALALLWLNRRVNSVRYRP